MEKILYPVIVILLTAMISGVSGESVVHYIDVGQGEAQLLESGGRYMLIDAGPPEAADALVSFLSALGVTRLDVVVLTNPDEDHSGGLGKVLTSFPVDLFVDNGESYQKTPDEEISPFVESEQISYLPVGYQDIIPFADGITVQVVHPFTVTGDPLADSLALKVTDGSVRYLLLGSASGGGGDLSSEIVSIGGQGSTGISKPLFERINPDVAIISFGFGNQYEKTAADIMNELIKRGVRVYHPDMNGDMVITSDGDTYTIQTEKLQNPITQVFTAGIIPDSAQASYAITPGPTPTTPNVESVYGSPSTVGGSKTETPPETTQSGFAITPGPTPTTPTVESVYGSPSTVGGSKTKTPPDTFTLPYAITPAPSPTIPTTKTSYISPSQTTVSATKAPASLFCDCSKPGYFCSDFPLENGLTCQQCYDYCKSLGKGDIHSLDENEDGIVCND
ncbi:MAG: MBL fold metallo-hydrolase [Methanospirillaceae archaeon]|nr:MBL fold metallo-hydrolase [Methanospirillaceae archaeon]